MQARVRVPRVWPPRLACSGAGQQGKPRSEPLCGRLGPLCDTCLLVCACKPPLAAAVAAYSLAVEPS